MAGIPSNNASPRIDVELYGVPGRPNPPIIYSAIVDTGFTGAVSIPTLTALPLGLMLYSTANFTLADGSVQSTFLCAGKARIGNEERIMAFSLSRGNDILVGMEFLSLFKVKLELDYKTNSFSLVPQS